TNPPPELSLSESELNQSSALISTERLKDESDLSFSAIKNPDFEKNLLIQISEHLAIAVENAKFYWQTQSQASREFLINQITKSIRQSLDMDKILQTAAMELGKVTGVSRCYITYFSTGFIVPHTFSMLSGPKEASLEGMSLEQDRVTPEALRFDNSFLEVEQSPKIKLYQYIMHGVSTLIMNQQNLEHRIFYLRHQSYKNVASQETDNEFNPFVLNDTRDCSGMICPQDFFKMNEIKSLAIFPILVEERLVGTITLHQCDTFRSWIAEDIQLLQAIAEHLGVALRQSRLFAELENQKTALESALVELQQTQVHLVQSEKMAILGQFVAGIAHEVNTPLGTISSNNNTLKSCVNKLTQETSELTLSPKAQSIFGMMHNLIDLNNMGTERIHEIVKNLRNFARLDESALKVVDIHEGIDSTLLVMQSSLSSYIKIVKNYSETLPQVQCYPGLLNQVFMNLLVNATHAMAEMPEGTITIETYYDEETDMIHVCFLDTGTGIAPEHLSKLFDPTFTTKRRGLGTGLGLALSFRIVEKHRGRIIVDTEMGVGTKFSVVIPVKQNNNT
ncbi:MAG: GAF domain-containing protein, partial [Cyanobacteria bacterium]|nr:GAF domain-containing protein [Cyanobacteriota bacterium]